jgi:hypothetical protein
MIIVMMMINFIPNVADSSEDPKPAGIRDHRQVDKQMNEIHNRRCVIKNISVIVDLKNKIWHMVINTVLRKDLT